MPDFKNYDPGAVTVVFKEHQLGQFASGEMVSATMNEDAFSEDVGAQGDVVLVRNRNETGTVTVRLQQTSPSNDVLTAYHRGHKAGTSAPGPIMIQDLRGTTLVFGEKAWIKKAPDMSMADDHSPREWVFGVAKMDSFVGGNLT